MKVFLAILPVFLLAVSIQAQFNHHGGHGGNGFGGRGGFGNQGGSHGGHSGNGFGSRGGTHGGHGGNGFGGRGGFGNQGGSHGGHGGFGNRGGPYGGHGGTYGGHGGPYGGHGGPYGGHGGPYGGHGGPYGGHGGPYGGHGGPYGGHGGHGGHGIVSGILGSAVIDFSTMRLKLLLWMTLFILTLAEEQKATGSKSLLYRIFYPIFPWRFTTPSPATTTQTPEDLEAILQAIDTPAFIISNGSLSLNDTELVVVENGSNSFRIIDDEHVIQTNDTVKSRLKLSTATSTPTPRISIPPSKSREFHRRLPVSTTTPKCEKLTEKQKYAKLESIGGRNQQFMANSPEEAARNFPHLVQTEEEVTDKASKLMSDAVGSGVSIDADYCDETCEEIRSKLHDALKEKQKHRNRNFIRLSDSGPAEVQEGKPDKWKGGCYLEKFVPVGNCSSRGDEEIWGHEKLCTACQGVYILSDDCFPTFFNSITCDKSEVDCIFDQYTSMAHGKCQAKTLSFKVMRNKGSKECEEWVFEYIDVPIACECFLSKSSFLRSVPEL